MVKFSNLLVDKSLHRLARCHLVAILIFLDVVYHIQLYSIDIRRHNIVFTTNGCSYKFDYVILSKQDLQEILTLCPRWLDLIDCGGIVNIFSIFLCVRIKTDLCWH